MRLGYGEAKEGGLIRRGRESRKGGSDEEEREGRFSSGGER